MNLGYISAHFIYIYLALIAIVLWYKDSKIKEVVLLSSSLVIATLLLSGIYFETFTSDRFVDFNISNYSRLMGILTLFVVIFYRSEKYFLDRVANFLLLPISYIFVTTEDAFILLGSAIATKSILLSSVSKNLPMNQLRKYKIIEMISIGFLLLFAVFFSISVKSPVFVDIEVENYQLYSLAMIFLVVTIIEISSGIFMGLKSHILSDSTGPARSLYFFYGIVVVLYKLILVINNLLIEAEPEFQRSIVSFIKYYAPINFFMHNFLAINQSDIKKFFNRIISSLLGLVLLSVIVVKSGSIKAELIYYLISILISYILISEIYDLAKNSTDASIINENPFEALYRRNKIATVVFILAVLNLVGIPFTYGFSSKFFFLLNYFQEGYIYPMLVILLSSVFVLPDVMKVISSLFSINKESMVLNFGMNKTLFLILFSILIVIFGVYPKIYF
ncbi:MAG: hypothetical protein JNM93_09915 [Bacteriovoracaceae bacterium]|nr:hypothetical protein [Bacteriovoracaceae bacterium]